jgi:hypothetical protein
MDATHGGGPEMSSMAIVYKALAILKACKRTMDTDPKACEEMLSVIWKEIENDIQSGKRGVDFSAYPASLALSHYFYYRGNFQKGIDRLERLMRLKGQWDDEKMKELEKTVDVVTKQYTR